MLDCSLKDKALCEKRDDLSQLFYKGDWILALRCPAKELNAVGCPMCSASVLERWVLFLLLDLNSATRGCTWNAQGCLSAQQQILVFKLALKKKGFVKCSLFPWIPSVFEMQSFPLNSQSQCSLEFSQQTWRETATLDARSKTHSVLHVKESLWN